MHYLVVIKQELRVESKESHLKPAIYRGCKWPGKQDLLCGLQDTVQKHELEIKSVRKIVKALKFLKTD